VDARNTGDILAMALRCWSIDEESMAPLSENMDELDIERLWITARPAVFRYPPGTTFGPRTLRDFEFVWVLSGSADWHRIDTDEHLTLEPGALLLARPGMRDVLRWSADETTSHGYVHFDLAPRPDSRRWPLTRPHAIAPSPLPGLLEYLLWLAANAPTESPPEMLAVLATVLRIYVSCPLPGNEPPAEPLPLASALDHARDAWGQRVRPLPLGELAAAAGVTAEHLARLCRQHYGCSLAAALELTRLDLADELLMRTNLSITAVARACGYDDPLYFSKRFRRHYGRSPRSYRDGAERRSPLDAAGLRPFATRVRPTARR
jgi:AraC-like DNA-binding protein